MGERGLFGGGGRQPVEQADTGARVRDGVGIDRHGDLGAGMPPCNGSKARHIKCDELWKLNRTKFKELVSLKFSSYSTRSENQSSDRVE